MTVKQGEQNLPIDEMQAVYRVRLFVEHHGEYQCTGCGRCVSLCPVSIDIIDILSEVPGYER